MLAWIRGVAGRIQRSREKYGNFRWKTKGTKPFLYVLIVPYTYLIVAFITSY